MRDYVSRGDQLTEACGVFTGPRITVLAPANNVRYSGVLPIHVNASSSVGVFRITLKVDGRLIRNFGKGGYPSTMVGAMEWFGAHHISFGRHTLTFIAYDRQRNVSETSITIVHVANASSSGGGHGAGAHGNSHVKPAAHGKKKRHRSRRRRHRAHARKH
jgi:hypothetical protein